MEKQDSSTDLAGLLVVTIEQAVAAPYVSCRLADAGARVIKVERPEGDFATRGGLVVNCLRHNVYIAHQGYFFDQDVFAEQAQVCL